MRRTRLLAVLVVPLLAGCGTAEVPPEELEEQLSARLAEATGVTPDAVTCTEPLPASEGERVRCSLVDGEEEYGVTVTTTGVVDDRVDYDIRVDSEPVS